MEVEFTARSVKSLKYCFKLKAMNHEMYSWVVDFPSELFYFYFRKRFRDREARRQEGGIIKQFFCKYCKYFL